MGPRLNFAIFSPSRIPLSHLASVGKKKTRYTRLPYEDVFRGPPR